MKIFISHSSKDSDYGKALVQLLRDIGISHQDIIFTSEPGYGIPKGRNIFNWLKSKIKERPYIIYMLSENYYSSVACLNEMGAAWVVENEHVVLFLPNFDYKNPKFLEGAINPRKMGIYMDNEHDIIEFVGMILNKLNSKTNRVIFNRAIRNYMESITEIKDLSDNQAKDEKDTIARSDKSSDDYKRFLDAIHNEELDDEEILLIKYIIDEGKYILRDGWKIDEEISDIQAWEEKSNLKNFLSNEYRAALNKFKMREFVDVYSITSYGNPKECILNEEISNRVLNLPKNVLDVLNEVLKKYEINYDKLPF